MLQLFKYTLLGVVLALAAPLTAQDDEPVFLLNPSFEDLPRHSWTPAGWTNCGDPSESPPDVHPDPTFLFKVGMRPSDGNTFLGMVTRENETYESIGQQLTRPLRGGQCYRFDLELARSRVYLSKSKVTGRDANYVKPIRLQVYGGYSICDRRQLLGESGNVANFEWRDYAFKLEPTEDYTHIILQAYYEPAQLFAYNGNILLDNARPLEVIPCDDPLLPREIVAKAPENPDDRIEVTKVPPARRPVSNPPSQPAVATPAPPPVAQATLGGRAGEIRQGTVFRIEQISFKANSAELEDDSEDALEEIVSFMKENENVVVEIGGHASRLASTSIANDLSESRARSVVSYLQRRGISFARLTPKGYGKRLPVCTETSPDCNRRNQRVEVKILKVKT